MKFTTPAYATNENQLYLAQDLSKPQAQNLDDGEFLDITELPLKDAVQKVLRGEILDAKTQTALLKILALQSGVS